MRAISPNTGAPERVVAEEQPEYSPLPVAFYRSSAGAALHLSAWVPERAELRLLAAAFIQHLTVDPFSGRMTLTNVEDAILAAVRAHPVMVGTITTDPAERVTPVMVTVGRAEWTERAGHQPSRPTASGG